MRTGRVRRSAGYISRFLLVLGLAAGSLAGNGELLAVAAQSKEPANHRPRKYIFLLPEGFKGWVCVDFNVAGAPPLPREGDAVLIRPRQGEVLSTSDKAEPNLPVLDGDGWFEVNGNRRPLPEGVSVQAGMSRSGPNEPTERECAFVGTLDEREASGDRVPGFENRFPGSEVARPIPKQERDALVSLYKSTNGDHWTHHVGWLGPEGTECNWHGIACFTTDESPGVASISLSDNNLSGALPEELGGLTHLDSIRLAGNHLSGKLPDALLRKWLAGSLWIVADPSAFTDISEVDYESAGTSLLCAQDRIVLRSDGTAKLFSKKCRNRTPQDRASTAK